MAEVGSLRTPPLLISVDAWSIATQAEANLYLGHRGLALDLYRRMVAFEAEPWQYASTALQAGQIASKLQDSQLVVEIERHFRAHRLDRQTGPGLDYDIV